MTVGQAPPLRPVGRLERFGQSVDGRPASAAGGCRPCKGAGQAAFLVTATTVE